MDQLSEVLSRLSISAGVFYSGGLCGMSHFGAEGEQEGHIHLLKQGRINLINTIGATSSYVEPSLTSNHQPTKTAQTLKIDKPCLIFYPKPLGHRIEVSQEDNAELVCATVRYGMSTANPITFALPSFIIIDMNKHKDIAQAAQWLFEESATDGLARNAIMDRLCELLIIMLLRHTLQEGKASGGLLAGLSNPYISRVLLALHQNPQQPWTLDQMAEKALLSRSKFAALFKEITKQTPADYLTDWRIGIAQTLLKQGKTISYVADQVGYENGSALARVFRKKVGLAPKQWQKQP